MARPRNNITKLPRPLRKHICRLLDEGATYDEVRVDDEVAAACVERGLELHNKSFLAYRTSPEYDEFTRLFRERDEEMDRNGVAACLAQAGAADDIAAAANYELLRLVMKKLKPNEEKDLDAKEIAGISNALAAYERNRIAAAKDDVQRAAAARETEYQAKIAEMAATIANLSDKLSQGRKIDSRKVAEDLDAALGVR